MFGFSKARPAELVTLDTKLTAVPNVSIAEREGRAVLMDLRGGRYYGLDEVATRIWHLLETGGTPAEIMAAVEREYDAPAGQLREDTMRFLRSLADLGLVTAETGR